MQVVTSFENPPLNKPGVITIGTYDSIHLGHQLLLKETIKKAQQQDSLSVVVTYSNHPVSVLKPDIKVCNLLTKEHKLRLLEELGIDVVFLLTFTKEFSEMSSEQFLDKLDHVIKIKALVLGYDSVIGKNREGNREVLNNIASRKGFNLEYMPELHGSNSSISTSKIRQLIFSGDLKLVSELIGRPYSIYIKPTNKNIVSLKGLCLPPDGKYNVILRQNGKDQESEIVLKNEGLELVNDSNDFYVESPLEIIF